MASEIIMDKKSNADAADAQSVIGHEAHWQGLRRVPDKLPKVALLILAVEVRLDIRFGLGWAISTDECCTARRTIYVFWSLRSYPELHKVCYSVHPAVLNTNNPFRLSNPYEPGSDLPGALGKGQAVATALGNFFKFWAYASTVTGAIIAGECTTDAASQVIPKLTWNPKDQYLGKFKAICYACVVYVIGLVILVSTSTPTAILNNAGLGGLIAAMITIGLGTGGIKANVTPMCAEQYQNSRPVLKTLKSGEEVVVDPELTVQRLFMW